MKIVLAGFPKTGTKTLSHALRSLGYSVYDYEEHFWYHGHKWAKIMKYGPSPGDFLSMYKDIDVVSDMPASFFWEDILQEFPDAKVILMVRESDNQWYESIFNQAKMLRGFVFTWVTLLSPTALRHFKYFGLIGLNAFGYPGIYPWTPVKRMPMVQKVAYRRHNCSVIENVPKDQLLVYQVKEGWEPLCKFLKIQIPHDEFPHENKGGKVAEDIAASSPVFKRIKLEFLTSLTLVVGLAGITIFRLARLKQY